MRSLLKKLARAAGVNVFTRDRFGVEMENDLARLTASRPLRTIFDVGANFGQTATRFADAFPEATIWSFEPVPESFEKLKGATAHLPSVRPVNAALGAQAGEARINLTESAGSSTLHATGAATGTGTVRIDTLDHVVAEHAIDGIDLLKIDVEGYELQVLDGGKDLLRNGRVRYVFAECVLAADSAAPHTEFATLNSYLGDRGFCCVTYYGESFALGAGVSMGNALFALRSALPGSVPGKVRNIT